GIGVALTAAAMAAAGTDFLYASPNDAKNRKKGKSWTLKAKGEVLEAMEQPGQMTAEEYQSRVDGVAAGYSQVKDGCKADLKDFKDEMMQNWQKLAKQAGVTKKAATKSAKKAVKKATK